MNEIIVKKQKWNKYKGKYKRKEYIRYRYGQVYHLFTKKDKVWDIFPVKGRKLLTDKDSNIEIRNAIEKGNPYFVGRFGHTEINFIARILDYKINEIDDNREAWLQQLCNNAGFFPTNMEMGEKYVNLMLEACKEVDLQAIWNLYMEDYLLDMYAPSAKTMPLRDIEPWVGYCDLNKDLIPWSRALKGKKVLVVNPFIETIQKQYYANREKIFDKLYTADEILPEFDLKVVKAVQTIANNKDARFSDWFEALEWMYNECMEQEFDVALIGCGAYGYPLAAKIKKAGKIAIHMGASVQLMFGIIGKRWENNERFCQRVLNESWVKASEEERPKGYEKIENSCYW